MSHEAYCLAGTPLPGGILVVVDHASNRVPDDIDLGIDPALLSQHIAIDIGVGEVARRMAAHDGTAAFLANVSRLVCDYNRYEDAPTVVTVASDGHDIPGNVLDAAGREARLERFFRPYHAALERLLDEMQPRLVLSLHSFTPQLRSDPQQLRPWHCGVLYNQDERVPRIAIPLLAAEGLVVGDQEPYSGKLLNATMNRHCEGRGRPYLGLEVRQDQIADAAGQGEWAERLHRICNIVARELAS